MHQLKQISCVLLILLYTRLAYTFGKFLYFKYETISTTKSLKSIFTIVIEENNTAWIPCHIFQNSMSVYFLYSVVIFVKNKQIFIWNPLIYVFLFISHTVLSIIWYTLRTTQFSSIIAMQMWSRCIL